MQVRVYTRGPHRRTEEMRMAAVLSDRGHRSDAAERPGMTTYCNRRVQAGMCAHIPAATRAGRVSRLIGQIEGAS